MVILPLYNSARRNILCSDILLNTNDSSRPIVLKYYPRFVNYQGSNTLHLAPLPYGGGSLGKESPEKAVSWTGILSGDAKLSPRNANIPSSCQHF